MDRQDGQRLVFAGAQDWARRVGKLHEGSQACFETSVIGRDLYILRTANSSLVMRVPLVLAREMLHLRRSLARRLLRHIKLTDVLRESSVAIERRLIRVQVEQLRALVWAIGSGRRVPSNDGAQRRRWILLALLLCGGLPGLIYYRVQVRPRQRQYRAELSQLVYRWYEQGKPDPPASFFLLYDL